ncbi:MAG TPA: type II toxin-antitoxin system RelE/ParE family toxin [Bryobacteraceae bacterium]|jgi:plasmid stabilization system protein ParE|nr:type II toxin-antitoxin system RelE/ParE family toxin [Bryobacteraceae bacterium]
MTRYRVFRDAERDLDGIFAYWAVRAGLDVVERLIDAIMERFWVLGAHPEAGRACIDIGPGVRCSPAGKYLIYYRKGRRGINISRIFHGARSMKKPVGKKR